MKLQIKSLIVFAIAAFLFLASSNKTQAQLLPILLADSVEKFGPPQEIVAFGHLLKIRTKLLKHFGTTCMYEVEITNKSSKETNVRVGFTSVNGNKIEVFTVNSAMVRLKPNYYAVYKLEKRECLKRGNKNPLISCMTCNPVLGFL